MARPSTLLRWANAVSGSFPGRLEPNDGKKDVGFDDGEAPPAGHHNWLWGIAGDWVTYLDEQATRLLTAALVGAANVFTQSQTIDIANDPSVPLITTSKTAHDYTTNPTNGWKLILDPPMDSTRRLRFFAGANDSSGAFALTQNAHWRLSDSKWEADDSGKASVALLFFGDQVQVSSRGLPNTGTWSVWPTNLGDLTLGGSLSALGGLFGASGLSSTGAISTAADYAYGPLKLRTSIINLADCSGDVVRNTDGSISVTATGKAAIKVRLPKNATYGDIEIMHEQTTADGNLFGLVTRRAADWTTPAGPSVSTPVTAAGPAAIHTTTPVVTTLATAGMTFDTSQDEVEIVWQLGNVAATANKILQIRMVNWQDNGPRNDL
jgi:hypothetical protein